MEFMCTGHFFGCRFFRAHSHFHG